MVFHRPGRLISRARAPQRAQGYILLTLMLFVALIAVATAVIVPTIAFEIKRDREEELVHRGVEYSRAIQRFAKVNARYPLRLEELQSTGSTRFIRKLYKDPITGGDFRLLYQSDLRVATGNLQPGDPGYQGNGTVGGTTPASIMPSGVSRSAQPMDATANPNAAADGNNTTTDAVNAAVSNPAANSGATSGSTPNGISSSSSNPVPLSGGAIIGVASKSTARTIREYDKKNHYNDWLFFYVPGATRDLRITGPTPLTVLSAAPLNPGTANGVTNGQNSLQTVPATPQAAPIVPTVPQSSNQQ